jgi:Protein of unknown function (DUF1648)
MNPPPAHILPPETLAPTRPVEISTPPDGILTLLARDRTLLVLVALALVVNLALFAYLVIRFDALPDLLPLHFDVLGQADRIEAKTSIFGLPLIGLIVFFLNSAFGALVHRPQRAAALFLTTAGLLVQLLMWIAALSIIGGFV